MENLIEKLSNDYTWVYDFLALIISIFALYFSYLKDKNEHRKKMGLRVQLIPMPNKSGDFWKYFLKIDIINQSRKRIFVDRIKLIFTYQSLPNRKPLSFSFPISKFLEPEEIFDLCNLNNGNPFPLTHLETDEIETSELIIDAFITDSMGNSYQLEGKSFNSLDDFSNEAFLILPMKKNNQHHLF